MKTRLSILFLLAVIFAQAQNNNSAPRPKLVVGLVVDQMRWDYLYRYNDRYGNGGFKRMLNQGFSCENTFMPFLPTYTAAGHSSVYTGSVPSLNGILGNNWYRKDLKRHIYCTEDNSVTTVGSTTTAGKMSPKNMIANTITDELRLAQNFRNKTIAIAIKDRGSILPGGHSANQAYWYDGSTGSWISSSYYMNDLPVWVKQFNNRKLPDQYLKQNWQLLHDAKTYVQSSADDKAYEGDENKFPHLTAKREEGKYELFKYMPQANTFTFDMAKAAIENEKLGQSDLTDFLAVSISSTDYMGHSFGPNSIEAEDMYLRLDKDIESFFNYLDQKIGAGNYLVFLTADHGVAHVAGFLTENKLPAKAISSSDIRRDLNQVLQTITGTGNLVESFTNYQVYLNDSSVTASKQSRDFLKSLIVSELLKKEGIQKVVDLANIKEAGLPSFLEMMIINGYNQKYSGELQVILNPQWYYGSNEGTTHGNWNPYDAHIPLLWYGWKIKPGKTNRNTYMTDIAPTLAALLNIQMPNSSIGQVIEEVLK